MHINSLFAYATSKLSGRKKQIVEWLQNHGPATDNEVALGLGFSHKSYVQPRLSDLIREGLVVETGTTIDRLTGKPCRKVGLR
jgi:predicted ArsR family transcriptional regulator